MKLARVTAPFWAPVFVGILAGLMLWSTGLSAAFGAEMVEKPTDQFWGDRTSYLKDPDGYLWMIATKIAVKEGQARGSNPETAF